MRLLPTAALLAVALSFTVGGVAIVGRADSSGDKPSAAAPAAAAAPGQCETPKPITPARIPSNRVTMTSDTISLNTRGYNYADPGEIQMDPTGRTPAGKLILPADHTQPPAAPAKP